MAKTINLFKKPKQVVHTIPLAFLIISTLINSSSVILVTASPIITTAISLDSIPLEQDNVNVTENILKDSNGFDKDAIESNVTTEEVLKLNQKDNRSLIEILFAIQNQKVVFAFDIVSRILIFLYCCLVIGYLSDEYFVPSLEYIGKSLDWPDHLTGAILIPFGTSGPEIFSSAVGVFFAENDIGTGAILGSSVFNMLAIPAASAIAAFYFIGNDIRLQEIPILRDLVFYVVSIIVLILVIKDNSVDLLDSSLMLIMFVIYIGVMLYNAKYNKQSADGENENVKTKREAHAGQNVACLDIKDNNQMIKKWNLQQYCNTDINNNNSNKNNKRKNNRLALFNLDNQSMVNKESDYYDIDYESYFLAYHNQNKDILQQNNLDLSFYSLFETLLEKKRQLELSRCKADYQKIDEERDDNGVGFTDNIILRWLLLPFIIIFSLTMPNRFKFMNFFISIGWLSIFSYFTVWSINGLSELLSIPSSVSGLTILSAGSAVPDLVTSVIVIKKTGTASMSICAAIASNIYAILLGLGVPWGVQFVMNWARSGIYSQSAILLESSALPYITIMLLATIFALYLTFTICHWKLSKKFALICLIIHIIFIISCCSLELLPKYL